MNDTKTTQELIEHVTFLTDHIGEMNKVAEEQVKFTRDLWIKVDNLEKQVKKLKKDIKDIQD